MNATPDELTQARDTLRGELALLQAKVAAGKTLRAAERRFLLTTIEPADAEYALIQGGRFALKELTPLLCQRCQKKAVPQYERTLAAYAKDVGMQ